MVWLVLRRCDCSDTVILIWTWFICSFSCQNTDLQLPSTSFTSTSTYFSLFGNVVALIRKHRNSWPYSFQERRPYIVWGKWERKRTTDSAMSLETSFQWLVLTLLASNYIHSPSARTATAVRSRCLLHKYVKMLITYPKWAWCINHNFLTLLTHTIHHIIYSQWIENESWTPGSYLRFLHVNLVGILSESNSQPEYFRNMQIWLNVVYIYNDFCTKVCQTHSTCLYKADWPKLLYHSGYISRIQLDKYIMQEMNNWLMGLEGYSKQGYSRLAASH